MHCRRCALCQGVHIPCSCQYTAAGATTWAHMQGYAFVNPLHVNLSHKQGRTPDRQVVRTQHTCSLQPAKSGRCLFSLCTFPS